MDEFELAPLALEKSIIGVVILVTAVIGLGRGISVMQRRWNLSNARSLGMFFASLAIVVVLSGYFQLAERFSASLTPFMDLIGIIGIFATTAFWSVGFYVLLGGKLPRNHR